MAAALAQNGMTFEPHMKGPLISSAVFHAVIVVIAIVGLPYMKPELPQIDQSITVELVDAGDFPKHEKIEKVKPPPEKEKEASPPKLAMPKVTASKPPSPIPPAPPEKIEEFTVPDKELSQIQKPEPIKTKKPAKKPERKEPVLTKPEEAQEEPFQGLLKNLMDSESSQQKTEDKPADGAVRQYSQMEVNQLSASIKRQLAQCWKLLYGARYAEDLIVRIKLFMNPDGSVRDARVINQIRYNADSFYRAAADAALRAVYNPQCNPLDLPYDKYDLWKVIDANFDPSQML